MRGDLDGTWMALAAVGVVGAARMAMTRGSRANGDDDENLPAVRQQAILPQVITAQRRAGAVPQLRQRAELALPDQQVWLIIANQADPLVGMTFERAAVEDPRRVDAMISQRIGAAFARIFGARPGPEAGELYLRGIEFAREVHGGELPVKALVSLVVENMDRALFNTFPRLPSFARAQLRRNLDVFDEALDEAAEIAVRASTVARRKGLDEDSVAWRELAEYLEGHKAMMRQALAQGLPGPAGRPMLGGARRMLPGPRGGGNRGSTARAPRLAWKDHGNWSEAKDPETGGTFKVSGPWGRKKSEAFSVMWFGPGQSATDNEIAIGHATTLENGKKRAARAHVTGARFGTGSRCGCGSRYCEGCTSDACQRRLG